MTTPIPLDEGDDGRPLLPPTPQGLPALVDDLERMARAVGSVTPCSCSAQRERAEAAEATLARVRALAVEWEAEAGEASEAWRVFGPQVLSVPFAVTAVLAILDAPAVPPSVHAASPDAPPATVETPEPVSGDESGPEPCECREEGCWDCGDDCHVWASDAERGESR